MKITAEPRSDQINADDLTGGPMTVTIRDVTEGKAEQKYDILLEGETRAWRPPLTVLRLLIACWGDDAANWRGQTVTLYRDPEVSFGKDQVGGIRVSHVTGIDKPVTTKLQVRRGKRETFTVEPLQVAPPLADEAIITATDIDLLRGMWAQATEQQQDMIRRRVQELQEQEGEQS